MTKDSKIEKQKALDLIYKEPALALYKLCKTQAEANKVFKIQNKELSKLNGYNTIDANRALSYALTVVYIINK